MEDNDSFDSLLDELEEQCMRREREKRLNQGSDVYLNVYDMIWVNDYTARFGIGAFHSGIQVHGREYAYGGHSYSFTGVYDVEPKRAAEIAGQGIKFRQSLHLGHTSLSSSQVHELVHSVGKDFNGNDYHIFNKNCNHFAAALSLKLSGAHIPHWINRLAYMSSWMPFILNCLPPAWITPGDPESEGQSSEGRMLYSACSKSPHSKSVFQSPSHMGPTSEDDS